MEFMGIAEYRPKRIATQITILLKRTENHVWSVE